MGFSLGKITGFLGGKGAGLSDLTPGGVLDDLTGRRNMREQNEWNLQMWNLQNEYNTPAAQMQRFKDAGLNPNLIYGQTNTAGPVHASAGAEGLGGALGKVFSTIAAIKNLKMVGAQVKNLQQQNENLKAQEDLSSSQSLFVKEQARRYAHDTDWLIRHDKSTFSPREERLMDVIDERVQGVADYIKDGYNNTLNLLDENKLNRDLSSRNRRADRDYRREKNYDKILEDRYFSKGGY